MGKRKPFLINGVGKTGQLCEKEISNNCVVYLEIIEWYRSTIPLLKKKIKHWEEICQNSKDSYHWREGIMGEL